jgi:tetratricopeptide (TPR) repeat protein
VLFGLPNLALGYASLGSTAELIKRYESEIHRAENLGSFFRDYFLAPLAWLYALEGLHEQAAKVMAPFTFDTQNESFIPIRAWNYLATTQLLFARGQYDQVVSLVEDVVVVQSKNGLNYHLGDLMLLQAEALLSMNPAQRDQARHVLQEARNWQEKSGSRRVLWRILVALADLVAAEEASSLYREARAIIDYIAEGIENEALQRSFLKHPDVEKVFAVPDI